MSRHLNTRAILILAAAALLGLGSCAKKESGATRVPEEAHGQGKQHKEKPGEDKHDHEAGEGNGNGDSHEHGEEKENHDAKLLGRLKVKECEHDVLILECDECRYEVGAVELSPELVKAGEGQLIKTARVKSTTRPGRLSLTGEVAFDEKKVVHISPLIGGVARRVFVTTGDRVNKGAPLFEMDSVELGRIRSSYLQARARVTLARENFQREKKLHADQISSGKERQQSETLYREAEIAFRAARDQLKLVGGSTSAKQGSGSAGRMTLRAPMAGVVVAKHVVPGERITPDKEILTVADLGTVWVWAHVYERDLARLLQARAGGDLVASVSLSAFPGKTFAGAVDYVGATMEETTRTVKVRVVVNNGEALLRPGMFASVAVELGVGGEALLVPAEAVVGDGADRFVFVRVGKKRFLRRDVTVGMSLDGRVEISKGLTEGEEIVVHGAFLLKSDVLREKMGAGCAD